MIKIAITGPESSGKSTLTKLLADYFQAPWCPEYSREYFKKHNINYSLADVITINEMQLARFYELVSISQNERIVFADTEAIVNRVWAEERFGFCPPEIRKTTCTAPFHLYLLCYPDIPWEYDPLREDEGNRINLFEHYVDLLNKMGANYYVIKGDGEQRIKNALRALFLNFGNELKPSKVI